MKKNIHILQTVKEVRLSLDYIHNLLTYDNLDEDVKIQRVIEYIKTLKEATITAVRLSEHLDAKEQAMFVAGFEECIKWQHSQNGGLYNEEDLKQAFIDGSNNPIEEDDAYGTEFSKYMDEWFERFKNK